MNWKKFTGAVFGAFLLAAVLVSGGIFVDAQSSKQSARSITSEQAIACINTAIGAQAGRITNLDIEVKSGKTVCEVEITSEEGKEYDVEIDIIANAVLRVREDR